jgi:Fe-S-cluster containining protein
MAGESAPPPDGSGLCTNCGICCSGVLFDTAPVEEDERKRLVAHGLTIHEAEEGDAEKPYFTLGCVRFDGRCCTIYDARPAICQRYRCRLLRKFDAGEVSYDDALKRVAEAKRLLQELPESLRATDKSAGHQWSQLFREWKAKSPAERAESSNGNFLLQLVILNRFLDDHFRDKDQRRVVEKGGSPPNERIMRADNRD